MTDEERHRLCANLRADAFALTPSFAGHNRMAAGEIERLAESLEAAHGYADECEAKIKSLSDQIDNLERRSAW